MTRRIAADLPLLVPCSAREPSRSARLARTAWAGILLLSMVAFLPADARAARSKAITCTVSGTGSTLVTTIALPSKSPGRRLTLEVKSGDSAAGFASQATVTRGRRTVMTIDSALSPTGTFSATVTFGHGFRGVRELALTSDNPAQTFQATVDGRAVLPFVAGADVSSLRFADDGKAPKLKGKKVVARGLQKLTKVPLDSCSTAPAAAAAGGIRPLIFDPSCFVPGLGCSDCDTCNLACNTYNATCRVTAGVAGGACVAVTAGAGAPACVPAWLLAEALCLKAWIDCGKNCENSIDACGGHLGERCSFSSTCGGDDQCCGGANNGGDCCQDQDNCCGKKCLEQTGTFCADPGKGVVCRFGAGDVCNDAIDPSACCPSERPACVAYGADPVPPNGLPGGGICCRRDQVFAGGECCDLGDVCGGVRIGGIPIGGTCCPSRVCLNGNTCCAPPEFAVCGANCCPALTSSCCNGQCCAGTCINNSLCCPRKQACGNVCCEAGTACVNPATGTCQSCLAGTESCEYSPGTPACCPTGTECCNNGQCCGAPNGQCCDFGEGPVCAMTCLR